MEKITNAFLAPFNTEASEKTTSAKVAMVYAGIGVVIGVFFLGK